ncbi:Similar to DCXR: L-xylulose reductase (Bos taurus) [Cotesia congregata]|uniref:Similar to DCXR: L-xylulose reductase (Bos taurus) n=1 Tax=Cotesia congregata TaxID=51543 RepID=A0A8J2MFK5_COTCN|nr:Similar to DCXR: L-xylulose reductase (Bos taurus) [Cotesia congregata]
MNISFKNKRILITGAGQGIGRDLALRLSKFNGTVIALSKTASNLDSLKKEDPTIETVAVDLADWEATRNAVKKVLPIDMLVNNAGVACLAPFLQQTEQHFDLTMTINVKSMFNVSQVVAEDLIKRKASGKLGPHNIRVNAVNPTVVLTAMGKLGWGDPEKARSMTEKIPLGRFAEVDEVIDPIVYLLSDRSSMINGVALPIDGGFLAT